MIRVCRRCLSSSSSSAKVSRFPGVTWDQSTCRWVYRYTCALTERPVSGSFSARINGMRTARRLAEKQVMHAHVEGRAAFVSQEYWFRIADRLSKTTDVEGVAYVDDGVEPPYWEASWEEMAPGGRKVHRTKRFPVDRENPNQSRMEAEIFRMNVHQWRYELKKAGYSRKVPDYESECDNVTTGGFWVAYYDVIGFGGRRRVKRPFSVDRHGFTGAERLAVEAVQKAERALPEPDADEGPLDADRGRQQRIRMSEKRRLRIRSWMRFSATCGPRQGGYHVLEDLIDNQDQRGWHPSMFLEWAKHDLGYVPTSDNLREQL
ncbi:hypothetical protein PBRA_008509 [Plasmodiophora brassicae]|uniref:Uncharacterized protein n=1 Tax=Plasmodiophora brassicae TaxID=37360 RepID=A0A0G4J132_PLABS|nr:hypothetical protein PBRA_008509 [Plasmodiophora brassicae]